MSTELQSSPARKEKVSLGHAPQTESQKNDKTQRKPTIQIVLRKATNPPQNKRSQSEPSDSKQKVTSSGPKADMAANTAPSESVELITALSNPLLYQRPALLPTLQKIIQSLEVAHATVEAYAAGDYLTEKPVNLALRRVLRAWTEFISPLNAIHGLKALQGIGPGSEERLAARRAVGQKLLSLAKDKQRCVIAIEIVKKLKRAYEDGSQEAIAVANKHFDESLVRLIQFATMMATIEHALQVAFERAAVKVIADGQELVKLAQRKDSK